MLELSGHPLQGICNLIIPIQPLQNRCTNRKTGRKIQKIFRPVPFNLYQFLWWEAWASMALVYSPQLYWAIYSPW